MQDQEACSSINQVLHLALTRTKELRDSSGQVVATFGELKLSETGLSLITLELPWQQNLPSQSRIPHGEYQLRVLNAEAACEALQLQRVRGRFDIHLSCGNAVGESQGSILLGFGKSEQPVPLVTSSQESLLVRCSFVKCYRMLAWLNDLLPKMDWREKRLPWLDVSGSNGSVAGHAEQFFRSRLRSDH